MRYVTEETRIIVEASLETGFPYLEELGFRLEREKRYKTNKHVFIKRAVRADGDVAYEESSLSGKL